MARRGNPNWNWRKEYIKKRDENRQQDDYLRSLEKDERGDNNGKEQTILRSEVK